MQIQKHKQYSLQQQKINNLKINLSNPMDKLFNNY